MAFEIVAGNSAYCCQNTGHRQLMALTNSLKISYQTEGNFSNSIYLELTKREGNSHAGLISAVFGTR